ncbi:MAG: family transcriptional regulator [Marmoricola sp.]|nr:family transcriptional regulator [Marmoricola sp.]
MAQTKNQQRAAHAVAAWMAHLEWNNTQLVAATGADPGTIGDFLNGKRWPKLGTQGKIERALGWTPGSLRTVAAGGPAPEPGDPVGGRRHDRDQNDDALRFRRPDGLTDTQWQRLKDEVTGYVEWQIQRTTRDL